MGKVCDICSEVTRETEYVVYQGNLIDACFGCQRELRKLEDEDPKVKELRDKQECYSRMAQEARNAYIDASIRITDRFVETKRANRA